MSEASDSFTAGPSIFASEQQQIALINRVLGESRLVASPLARILGPSLVALGWLGAARTLLYDLPAPDHPLGVTEFIHLLQAQGFKVSEHHWRQWRADHQAVSLPIGAVLLQPSKARIFLGQVDGHLHWHDGDEIAIDNAPVADLLLLVESNSAFVPLDAPQPGWLRRLFFRARREVGGVLLVSLVINLLTLAISLFTMMVYNNLIPSGATLTLWGMTGGVLIAIAGAWCLRLARSRLLARMTAWAGSQISELAMRKTLGLPLDVASRVGVDSNLGRLRSVEGVRQWFGGSSGVVSVDYPFVLIFLVVIGWLGGWIVLVPCLGLLLFIAISLPLSRLVQIRANDAGRTTRKLNDMLVILVTRLRALKGVDRQGEWLQRLSALIGQSSVANLKHANANALTQTTGQALAMLTVLATMAAGVALVLDQQMSSGGLIATMMLIWRVTTPAQQMFANQIRVRQLVDATQQLDQLLSSVGEAANPKLVTPVTTLLAQVESDRLYYRHSPDREPSLNGISFALAQGECLAVVGPNGAGKSTLLELLAGIRQPQNGRVLVGKHDIRQFDPDDYRSWLGYLPQQARGLSLSLRDAVALRKPDAEDTEIDAVLTRVAGPTWWRHFAAPDAATAMALQLSLWREDVSAMRMRYIVRMAAAMIGNPTLLLLDDPLGDRDPQLDAHFVQLLSTLKGHCTIIMATHRPDLIQRCDKILLLDQGAVLHFGPVNPASAA
jgi:ATP-binding cassette subfamily C protein LapB